MSASPWLRFCTGTAILLCAFSALSLAVVPLINTFTK